MDTHSEKGVCPHVSPFEPHSTPSWPMSTHAAPTNPCGHGGHGVSWGLYTHDARMQVGCSGGGRKILQHIPTSATSRMHQQCRCCMPGLEMHGNTEIDTQSRLHFMSCIVTTNKTHPFCLCDCTVAIRSRPSRNVKSLCTLLGQLRPTRFQPLVIAKVPHAVKGDACSPPQATVHSSATCIAESACNCCLYTAACQALNCGR